MKYFFAVIGTALLFSNTSIADQSATPTYVANDLRALTTSAGKYAAWADVCGDPAGAEVRSDFLVRADLLAPEEQADVIQRFERSYSKKKKNAEPVLERCMLQGKTDCCTVGAEVAKPFGFARDLYQAHLANLDAVTAPVEIAAAAPPVVSPSPSSVAELTAESSPPNNESVAATTTSPPPATMESTQVVVAKSENQTPRIGKLKVEDFDGIEWNPQILLIPTLVGIDVHLERCLGYREPIRANVDSYTQATKPPLHQGLVGAYDARYNKLKKVGLLNKYTQLGGDWHHRSDDCTGEVIEDLYFAYEKWEQSLLGIAPPVAVDYQAAKIGTLTIEDFAATTLNESTYNPVTLESIVQIDLHIEHCLNFREPIKANYDAYLQALKVDYWEDRSFQYENTHTNFGKKIANSSYTTVYPRSYKRSDCRTEVLADIYSEYEKWEKGLLDGTRSW